MGFPANTKVQRQAIRHPPVVLNVRVVLHERTDVERSVSPLAVAGPGTQEEVGILVAGVRSYAVVGSGRRIIDARSLIGIRDFVHRAIRQVGEMLVADTETKRQLMLAGNLVKVLVERGDALAHAVVPLRTTVGHKQIRTDGRKPGIPQIVRQPKLLFEIQQRPIRALHVHPLPLHAVNRLRKQRGRHVLGVSESTADRLHRDLLVTRRTFFQFGRFNIGRGGGRIVPQRLLLLPDIGKAEIDAILIVEDMVESDGIVRYGLGRRILAVQIKVDQRIVCRCGPRRGRQQRFRQRADARERNLIVGKRQTRVLHIGALRRIRVVELLQNVRAVDEAAEVPAAHRHRGHIHQLLASPPEREALVSDEEKRPVLAVVQFAERDWSADRSAEFVADQLRRDQVRWVLPSSRDAKEIIARRFEE